MRRRLALGVLLASAVTAAVTPSAAGSSVTPLPAPTSAASLANVRATGTRVEKPRPWDVSGAIGFPTGVAGRIARTFGDRLRIGVAVGSITFLSSAALGFDVRVTASRALSLHLGARAVGVLVCAPAGGCLANAGVGPSATIEWSLSPRMFLAIEAGALYGDWEGAYDGSDRWVPQLEGRTGFRF